MRPAVVVLLSLLVAGVCGSSRAAAKPHYVGRVVTWWDPDGVHMHLTEDFSFIDAHGLAWPVPKDTIVDGASIPRALWTAVGSPLTGKYRDASVIHDLYCDLRTRDWKSTDRVFLSAMLASGVPDWQARLLFAGVWAGGPRWDETATKNVCLHLRDKVLCQTQTASIPWSPAVTLTRKDVAALREAARPGGSLKALEERADSIRGAEATRFEVYNPKPPGDKPVG